MSDWSAITFEVHGYNSTGDIEIMLIKAENAQDACEGARIEGLRVVNVTPVGAESQDRQNVLNYSMNDPAKDAIESDSRFIPDASPRARMDAVAITPERRRTLRLAKITGLCFGGSGAIMICYGLVEGLMVRIPGDLEPKIIGILGLLYLIPGNIMYRSAAKGRPDRNAWAVATLIAGLWLASFSLLSIAGSAMSGRRHESAAALGISLNVLLLIPVCNLLYHLIRVLAGADRRQI